MFDLAQQNHKYEFYLQQRVNGDLRQRTFWGTDRPLRWRSGDYVLEKCQNLERSAPSLAQRERSGAGAAPMALRRHEPDSLTTLADCSHKMCKCDIKDVTGNSIKD